MFLPFDTPPNQFREGKKHQIWNTTFAYAIALYTFFKHNYSPIIICATLHAVSERRTDASGIQTSFLLLENFDIR
jgi:hypothetical protein